jgi:DNA repair protein RecN (Recombination protein N)
LQEKERKARDQQDFINFQLNEFQEAQVQADEEEQLEQELRLLQNSEEIREALGYSCETLYNREEGSAHQQLSEVIDQLERFSDVGEEYQRLLSQLVDARESIKESTFGLEHMLEAIDSDPERLSYIEERLAVYHNLKLKYKVRTGADLLALYEKLQLEESVYASLSGQILKLQQAASAGEAELIELAQQLESRRKEGIPLLEKKINGLLSEVGFQDAKVELALSRTQVEKGWLHLDEEALRPTSRGINKLSFLIRTNPGLPMGELSQIASGGEISRVMLAIKAALADKSEFPVLIFDEIDTGISGEIANKVGQVMRQLARRFQILSITHLPQIASKGDEHFIIFKEVADGRTSSSVRRLGLDERVYQIARMISGDDPSESAIRNALEMIG